MNRSGPAPLAQRIPASPEHTLRLLAERLSERTARVLEEPETVPAAVLIPFFVKGGALHLLFTRRTELVAHHKGEISFPGGQRDTADPDLLATALREAEEEMGIRPEDVKLLGRLDDTPTRTGFMVASFVGVIPHPYPFKPSPREIAEAIEAPVQHLLQPVNQREEVLWVDGRQGKLYSYAYDRHLIVGATARIVEHLFNVLLEATGKEGRGS